MKHIESIEVHPGFVMPILIKINLTAFIFKSFSVKFYLIDCLLFKLITK